MTVIVLFIIVAINIVFVVVDISHLLKKKTTELNIVFVHSLFGEVHLIEFQPCIFCFYCCFLVIILVILLFYFLSVKNKNLRCCSTLFVNFLTH